MFKHSQYQIYLKQLLMSLTKRSSKTERSGGREEGGRREGEQHYILSGGLCLTKNTLTEGQDIFLGSVDQGSHAA